MNSGVDCVPSPTCAPANAGHLLPASFPGSLLQRSHMVPAHASAQPDLSSCDFIASLISAETSETASSHLTPRAHGPFASEPVTRAFGHEGASKQALTDDDTTRPFKILKRAMSSSTDCLLCADVSPASTGHSLPLSSPCMPSPACLEPPSHLLLTDASVRSCGRPGPVLSAPDVSYGQVCMKLRSSSLRASLECGLIPE